MSNSSSLNSDPDFDLLDQEYAVIRRAAGFLEKPSEDTAGLARITGELLRAFRQSLSEQKHLMRAGDRQQEQLRAITRELQDKTRLLEEQARHLLILNTELAHEVEARKTLELELRILATTDPLTGVYNRRRFLELGAYEVRREGRTRRGLSLMGLDIDHFKGVNDAHGHGVGDETLVRFAQVCRPCLRAQDTIARIGGEEFAILMPETPLAEARVVAERMRASVAACPMAGPQGAFHITVSIGIAELGEEETFEALMARTDAKLYAAKRGGRNQVL